jgi:hypothetical protein
VEHLAQWNGFPEQSGDILTLDETEANGCFDTRFEFGE